MLKCSMKFGGLKTGVGGGESANIISNISDVKNRSPGLEFGTQGLSRVLIASMATDLRISKMAAHWCACAQGQLPQLQLKGGYG